MQDGTAMRICFHGDSITAAVYLDESDRYVTEVARRFGAEAINAGVPGDTSAGGVRRLATDVIAHNPDIVVLAFGMNDHVCVAENTPKVALDAFRTNLEHMIEQITHHGAKVVVCNVQPVLPGDDEIYYYSRHPMGHYRNPKGVEAWIDRYSEIARRVVDQHPGCALCDIAGAFMALDPKERRNLWRTLENSGENDGVHPTAAGQRVWARSVIRSITDLGPLPADAS